jgi:hypothetical protein
MRQVNGDHRPPYQVFPDLSPEEFAALRDDISHRGVQVAIEITEKSTIASLRRSWMSSKAMGWRIATTTGSKVWTKLFTISKPSFQWAAW